MKTYRLLAALLLLASTATTRAARPATDYTDGARRLADRYLIRPADTLPSGDCLTARRDNALIRLFEATDDSTYYRAAKASVDRLLTTGVEADETTAAGDYDLRRLCGGMSLAGVYRHNRGGSGYLNAMTRLRRRLYTQPRTPDRAFVFAPGRHDELRLEGLYHAMPFYCYYAGLYDQPRVFGDIALQFAVADERTLDPRTGLNRPSWSADNPSTPPTARALGWYMMALTDVLEHYPLQHAGRRELAALLHRVAAALHRCPRTKSGLWLQQPHRPQSSANPADPEACAMLSYALTKGVRLGYLPAKYGKAARKALDTLIDPAYPVDTNLAALVVMAAAEAGETY